MDIKKLAPWNWFKKENSGDGHSIAVKGDKANKDSRYSSNSSSIFDDEINQLFDNFFRGFGSPSYGSGKDLLEGMTSGILKPRLDLGATDKEYTISVEIPGVNKKNVSLELLHDTLIIRGEKNQEKEEKNKHFYRRERSYGSFQRTLSLPEDVDKDKVRADFKNGVLNITIPRTALPGSQAKQIEIRHA